MKAHIGYILQRKSMGWGSSAEKKEKKGGWIRKKQRGDFFFFFNTIGKMNKVSQSRVSLEIPRKSCPQE